MKKTFHGCPGELLLIPRANSKSKTYYISSIHYMFMMDDCNYELSLNPCMPLDVDAENEYDAMKPHITRLSKAEKRALKAEKLKEKRKFNSKQYKARRKEKLQSMQHIDSGLDTDLSQSEQPLIRKTDILEKLTKSLECGINVCIDLAFDGEHDNRERSSLAKQLSLSYGIIKKAQSPLHIHLCSLVSHSSVDHMLQQQGLNNWKVDVHCEASWDLYPTENLVFLSPDAEKPLEKLDNSKVRTTIALILSVMMIQIWLEC